jgi:hypothetical protein
VSPFPDAEDYINLRIHEMDKKLDRVAEDLEFIKGKMENTQPSKQEGFNIANKQNVLVIAIASLITTLGAVITKLTGGN